MKNRLHFYITGGILLIGLVLGSFFDLQINQALFDRYNGFGLTVSSFGMIPGYGALAFLGGALFSIAFYNKNNFNKWLRLALMALGVIAAGAMVYFLGTDLFGVNGFDQKNIYWLGFVIMGLVVCGLFAFGFLLGKKNENKYMWIAILIIFLAMLIALVPGVTLLKKIMNRPRYRIAVAEGYVSFHNWWEPFKDRDVLINAYPNILTKEEFKSYPSGHAGATMMSVIFLSYIPLLNKKWMKYQTLFFYIGFAWTLLVMFARLIVGAHYLSDVCTGALIILIFYYISNEIIMRKLFKEEEVKEIK